MPPSPDSEPAGATIQATGLAKDYGEGHGVFGLDLEVRSGEIVGFLGPNGAGKSTTMRMLLGLARPSAGAARVLGLDAIADSLAVRRRVGYLAGDFGLYPQFSGATTLSYLGRLRGGVPTGRIEALAERFQADLHRPVRELSTGNRQKLGLIQAFMHEPEVLVLDEPIAGLDPLVQRSFHDLLAEEREAGRAVLLSSHTLSEVDRVADRVAILRAGRIVTVDTLAHLRAVAVRRWEIEVDGPPPDPAQFRAIENVRSAEVAGGRLRVAFEGSADAILKAAARLDVTDLHTQEGDLEDIFLRYYRDDQR